MPMATKEDLDKCLVYDDEMWKANFAHDLRLLHQIFVDELEITLDVVQDALISMPLDDAARKAIDSRFKHLFENALGNRPEDYMAEMTAQASAHHHFVDVRPPRLVCISCT